MLDCGKNRNSGRESRQSKNNESIQSNQYANLLEKVESKQEYNEDYYEESLKYRDYLHKQQCDSKLQKKTEEPQEIVNVNLKNYVNNNNAKKPNSFCTQELYRRQKAAYLNNNNEENGYLRNFQKKFENKPASKSPNNTDSNKRLYKPPSNKQNIQNQRTDSQNNMKNSKNIATKDLKSYESIREIDPTDKDMSQFQQFLDKNFGSKNESCNDQESRNETDYIEMLKLKQNKLNPMIKTMNNNEHGINKFSGKNLHRNQNSSNLSSKQSFRSTKNNPFQNLMEKNESLQSKPEVFNQQNLPNHINTRAFNKKNIVNFQGFIDSIQQEELQNGSPNDFKNTDNEDISYKLMQQRKNLEDLAIKKTLKSNKENHAKVGYGQRNINSNRNLQDYDDQDTKPLNIRIDISNLSSKVASDINKTSKNNLRMI